MPCSEKRARQLLEHGRARVHQIYPFTIRLTDRLQENSVVKHNEEFLDTTKNTGARRKRPKATIYDSLDVAAYIAQQCRIRGIACNNTKMQKLLYCVYGIYLAVTHKRICKEYPRAWKYGPVFPKVFNYIHNGDNISHYSHAVDNNEDQSSDVKKAVDAILNHFGKFSPGQLAAWTYKKGSPWDKAVNGDEDNQPAGLHGFIPLEYISQYFKDKVLANKNLI